MRQPSKGSLYRLKHLETGDACDSGGEIFVTAFEDLHQDRCVRAVELVSDDFVS